MLSRLLQRLGGLLRFFSRLAGVGLFGVLFRRLHRLLSVTGLLSRLFGLAGGLLLIERLLAEPFLGLIQLLAELFRGVVQFLLALLLCGGGGSRLLSQLLHLLRGLLLSLREFRGLVAKLWTRGRVLRQLIGQLLSRLSGTFSRL